MKLLILPGFSLKNKGWANEAVEYLKKDFAIVVHEWKHWNTRNEADFSFKKEIERVTGYFKGEEYSVLAKSVGTVISAVVLSSVVNNVHRVIFCGIPLKTSDAEGKDYYKKFFKIIDEKKFLCFQNSEDPWGSFEDIKSFIKAVNSSLEVIKKESNDHSYPYLEDFKVFLTSGK